MPKFQSLTKIELIKNILKTVVICEQRRATRTLGQARRPLVHGNTHCLETTKQEVFFRNAGGF